MVNVCRHKLLVPLFCCCLLLLPLFAVAGTLQDAVRDFAPSSGFLLQQKGASYLVDIGAKKGAMAGDLLAVIEEGENVVHPVTGATLGAVDELLAVLRITKVKSEFSYAEPFGDNNRLSPGMKVRRFAGLSAVFVDQTGDGSALYAELSDALDSLDWQGYFRPVAAQGALAIPKADLLFNTDKGLLTVRDAAGTTVRAYPLKSPARQRAAAPVVVSQPPVETKAVPLSAATQVSWDKQTGSGAGVNYEVAFPGYQQLGLLEGSVVAADLYPQDGTLLLATTDGQQVSLYRQAGELTRLSTFRPEGLESIHTVNWWQPERNGSLYLSVSASKTKTSFSTTEELEISSYLLELQGDRLVPVADRISYLLGSFDRDGNGSKEALIGQQFDLERFFGAVKELQLNNGKLANRNPGQPYPPQFSAPGSVQADLTGDGELETAFVRDGILRIYKKGRLLYQLGDKLGGSLSQLTYDTNPGQVDALFKTVGFEIAPVAIDIDRDGRRELLVLSSEKPGIFSRLGGESMKNTQLLAIKYVDGGFRRGTLGGELQAPVQGLFADQEKVVLVAYDPEAAGDNRSSSRLLTIPLTAEEN